MSTDTTSEHEYDLQPFKYRPLDSPDAIRIVTLEKGASCDAIVCQLIQSERTADFEALSYEWGSPSNNDPMILVDGRALKVRTNLHEALLHLRLTDVDRYLWIDAICIDQANIPERNHQVSLMSRTYSSAQRVVVWLGPTRDSSDFAMDALTDSTKLKQDIASFDDSQYAAVLALLERSYWRRVWIQQELYLAREAVFHCGSRVISESAFVDSFSAVVPYRDGLMRPDPAAYVMMRHRKRDPTKNTLRGWLYVCLEQKLQCTEPRDIIYGMLGMSNDCQNGEISPDYEKPLSEVFLEAIAICKAATYSSGYSVVDFARDLANRLGISVDERMGRRICKAVALT
ncbi:heterokaryon incompatibility protein-domain-containing protein [Lophiotrema nucula]|uniref:Heterokaryon incompatibility protein-domain-containing protein n=1 Tax=Lophiotrema nucula TaxID=690887 RepID=A0A6A5ZF93_9PLEO|nr:heterokaryon incompatibility protein-domain-containing protein [Lophiotrema nucula]